ncbi:hypothetical protein [Gracilinema caldarium]|uniref:hypothetical protein n=1 Tax=Gracilinema caldarium TaxID=215591 RepID=UPI0026EC2FB4|nr:hypothetical protein [Gracilinema caldarium]
MLQFRHFKHFSRLLILFILLSCEDYSALAPRSTVYKFTVYNGSQTLDQGGFVTATANLRPTFLTSVSSDPDVQGLSVTLLDTQGNKQSKEILYSKSQTDTNATRVFVANLDSSFPTFSLPSDLSIGPYTLSLKVIGVDGILAEKIFPFYYLGDAILNIQEIRSYPPGIKPSETAPLFPPAVKLLLEGVVAADKRLDPYLIWYEGSRIIKQGRLTEGAQNILWKTPEAEGFQTIRLELYPENPGTNREQNLIPSVSATLKAAISRNAPIPGLDKNKGPYTYWFRFLGNLEALTDSTGGPLSFVKLGNQEPLWLPGDDNFGLAIGSAHQYRVNKPLLPAVDGTIPVGTVILRYAPYTRNGYGSLFSAQFDNQNEPEKPLNFNLYLENGKITLEASIGETRAAAELPNQNVSAKVFSQLSLGIEQRNASLILYNIDNSGESPLLVLKLPTNYVYPGTGSYSLGNSDTGKSLSTITLDVIPEGNSSEDKQTAANTSQPITAIIDEFAVKLSNITQNPSN